MIYHCFLDDSKDQKQQQMVISAGFYGTRNDWGSLRLAWTKRLREDGLKYFKTSEYKSLTGQFAKFRVDPPPTGRDKARKLRSELQDILQRYPGIRGIGVVIPVQDYTEVCSRPESVGVFYGDPYHRALESVMFETAKKIRAQPGRNMAAFVHDEGNEFADFFRLYQGFKKLNPKSAKVFGGFEALDDKLHPPLQAADMIANYTLGVGMKWLASGRRQQERTEMKQSIGLLGIWDTHYMLSILKSELELKGKPIPLDLQAKEFG
jgi:hypothetical protein